MKYSDLLKTAEWESFRQEFITSRKNEDGIPGCDDCGEEMNGTLHVHHKIYRNGLLPWEYDYDDLRLICSECHQRIHDTEEKWRNLIRRVPPHVCYEAGDLLSELEAIRDDGMLKIAFSRTFLRADHEKTKEEIPRIRSPNKPNLCRSRGKAIPKKPETKEAYKSRPHEAVTVEFQSTDSVAIK